LYIDPPTKENKVNTLKNAGSLVGGAAVVAAAVGLTAGLTPASAAPQQSPGVTLRVFDDPANPARSILRIQGKFPMPESAARDTLNHLAPGGGMDYVVYADDPGDSDGRIGNPHGFIGTPGPTGGVLIAVPDGLSFIREISVPKSDLNEDDGTDEVYVFARFVQGNGAGSLGAYTNPISGEF
jgi:hypothetical protein